MVNQKKEAEDIVYWQGIYTRKSRILALFSVSITATFIISFFLGIFGQLIFCFFASIFFSILSLIILVKLRRGAVTNYVVVTEKKVAVQFFDIAFWFEYANILDFKIRRSIFDIMFGTSTVVLRVIDPSIGKCVIRDLNGAEGFLEALTKAKKDHDEAEAARKDAQKNRHTFGKVSKI